MGLGAEPPLASSEVARLGVIPTGVGDGVPLEGGNGGGLSMFILADEGQVRSVAVDCSPSTLVFGFGLVPH